MKSLNFEQYVAFVLLFAANADEFLAREEVLQMSETVDKNILLEVNRYFHELNMEERMEVIKRYKHLHFPDPQTREFLQQELKRLLFSDSRLKRSESFVLGLIEDLLKD